MHSQIREICAILSGLIISSDYSAGQELLKERNFKEYGHFFQQIFEIGRRYKINNPEKMRSEYGKLIYLLQDSVAPQVQELLQFVCVRPIKTVYSYLQEKGADYLLKDPNIERATHTITQDNRSRGEIQQEIKEKEKAVEKISKKYASGTITPDEIKRCLYSIGDNNAYLSANRDPVDKMIKLLLKFFSPDSFEESFSLAIEGGQGGARLTHSHKIQYHYVLQSLTLWREILHDMYRLWYLAEKDLLNQENIYELKDTGQGLNRIQQAPSVMRAMHTILNAVQSRIGQWIGSSVIHLGDHNVPNSLMFIDKYSQVSRILNPIVIVIERVKVLTKDPALDGYITEQFGGVDKLRKLILVDFFRHGFDGSGADNFFDAGSCIDGRLTSAWNWCSSISQKPYYPVFLLAGFSGFDGDFNA